MEDIFGELAEEYDEKDIEEIRDGEIVEAIEINNGIDEDDNVKRIVPPKKSRTTRSIVKLDAKRLLGPRGLAVIGASFNNIKLKGKGYEINDLTEVLSRLQHWTHRLFPKMCFEDCINKIEVLGQKKEVARAMYSLRMGTLDCSDQSEQIEDPDPLHECEPHSQEPMSVEDPFDKLLPQAPLEPPKSTLTDEQRARMLKNRLLAEEIRMAKKKAAQSAAKSNQNVDICTESPCKEPVSNKIDNFSNESINDESDLRIGLPTFTKSTENESNLIKTSNIENCDIIMQNVNTEIENSEILLNNLTTKSNVLNECLEKDDDIFNSILM